MPKRLRLLNFHTRTVYFNDTKQVISYVQKFKRIKNFHISDKFGNAAVTVGFFPALFQEKNKDFQYSVITYTFLTGPNDHSAFIEQLMSAEIENTRNWQYSNFKEYISHSPNNIISMAAPVLRKATHLLYDLFSSDKICGEVYVPDMIDVFNVKVQNYFKDKNK